MVANDGGDGSLTNNEEYAARLIDLQSATWKEMLRFLDPYGWQIKAICKANTLEVGSGIGRNLRSLKGRSLGVDHNATSVEFANAKGFKSLTTEDFFTEYKDRGQIFDTLLLSHVLEHISLEIQNEIFSQYIPYLKPHARIVLICPQEVGFASDSTHIRWVNEPMLLAALTSLGCSKVKIFSFPFTRRFGTRFIYNQFVAIGNLS